jgi:hypothetical protein
MFRDRVEIGILMQYRGVFSDRDGCDQAVGKPANRLSLAATRPVQGGRALIVGGLFEGEQPAAAEHLIEAPGMRLIPGSGQDLEDDQADDGKGLVGFDDRLQAKVGGTVGRSLELDPRRAVYENHERGSRGER